MKEGKGQSHLSGSMGSCLEESALVEEATSCFPASLAWGEVLCIPHPDITAHSR